MALEWTAGMLREIEVRRVLRSEEERYQRLMQAHHYLGALPKIGETLWYVGTWCQEWVALLSFSAAALKCAVRDRWIGWSYRQQYARLQLLANNTRFCILPAWHRPNVASRTLALCERRLGQDWIEAFGHPIVLLETFVDPQRHRGTLYQASNWVYVGDTRGYRRRQGGYSATPQSPKKVFMRCLHAQARALLCQPHLEPPYVRGVPKLMLTASQMQALPAFFAHIPDPRRGQGRRHTLSVVLAIAAAATLCGARG
ncbi:MAG: Druantia anti-phage system protein DruA, partial [Steroidobacteraceae bacterium]